MHNAVDERPAEVTASDGLVLVDGPGSIAVTLTPEAAEETAARLSAAALVAYGQRGLGNRAVG